MSVVSLGSWGKESFSSPTPSPSSSSSNASQIPSASISEGILRLSLGFDPQLFDLQNDPEEFLDLGKSQKHKFYCDCKDKKQPNLEYFKVISTR